MKLMTWLLLLIPSMGFSQEPDSGHQINDMSDTISEPAFTFVEKMPVFPGGQELMYKYLHDNIQCPEGLVTDSDGEMVIVQFVVWSDGEIRNARVVRGKNQKLQKEALRIITSMNENHRWEPGMHKGEAVPVTFTLPIKFHCSEGK
jgi:TonB family protein